jgi:hypothetical protein
MKRVLKICFLFIFGCAVAALAVANRQPVRLVADPFIDRDRAASIEAPLFVYLFAALFAGLLLGACAVWLGQGHWRKAARLQSRQAAQWKREAEALKAGITAGPSGNAAAPRLRSYI